MSGNHDRLMKEITMALVAVLCLTTAPNVVIAENVVASSRDNEVLKAVQAALASTEQRLQQSEVVRTRLVEELKVTHGQLTACQARINAMTNDDNRKLMLLADKGEAVLFREVGEAQMAVLNGRSVLRFPLTAATRADRALLGIKSERYLNGSFAYYIVDTKFLNY